MANPPNDDKTPTTPAIPATPNPTPSPAKKTPIKNKIKKSPDKKNKVLVHFIAVGSAPLMKKDKFHIGSDQSFRDVIAFLHRMLFKNKSTPGMSTNTSKSKEDNNGVHDAHDTHGVNGVNGLDSFHSSSLFLYCNQAFVPSPDARLGDLRDCFHVRDELKIHYALQEAWG